MEGIYDALMDDKFRVSLPIQFKDELSNGKWIIAKSIFTPSLQIITRDKFNSICQKVCGNNMSDLNPRVQEFKRLYVATCNPLEFDKSLRIMIPRGIRDIVNLDNKAQLKILGMGDEIELWNTETYNEYRNSKDESGELVAFLQEMSNIADG